MQPAEARKDAVADAALSKRRCRSKSYKGGLTVKYLKAATLFLVLLTLAACGSVTPTPELSSQASTASVYKGRATAIKAKALGINALLADTGSLPTKGGALEKTLVTASVPQLLSAGVLHAATIGQGNHTRSEASVAGLNLTVAGIGIKANFVSSQADTACSTAGKASVSGSSQITGLVINGKSVTVTGSPNQTINVLGLVKIVINEQSGSASGATGKKTVNALHVTALKGVVDVTIASSYAELTCKTVRPSYGDFVTGSGSIKANCGATCGAFSLSAGKKNGALFGSLTYIDSAKNLTVKSTKVTSYTVVNSKTRLIKGTATVNGKSGFRYEVTAADNGKGTTDTFSLKVYNSSSTLTYSASGKLICGNLQLHSTSPSCACSK